MLPEFDLLMPHTLPEALDVLAQGGPDVAPLAGGTALLVDMRGGHLRPRTLMDVSHLPASSEPFGKVECRQARIALGAVAPRPIRAHAAEEALRGQPLTPEAIAEAAHLAVEATCCIDDLRGSAAYRQRVTEVLVRRALTDVATFPPSRKLGSFREGNS